MCWRKLCRWCSPSDFSFITYVQFDSRGMAPYAIVEHTSRTNKRILLMYSRIQIFQYDLTSNHFIHREQTCYIHVPCFVFFLFFIWYMKWWNCANITCTVCVDYPVLYVSLLIVRIGSSVLGVERTHECQRFTHWKWFRAELDEYYFDCVP